MRSNGFLSNEGLEKGTSCLVIRQSKAGAEGPEDSRSETGIGLPVRHHAKGGGEGL